MAPATIPEMAPGPTNLIYATTPNEVNDAQSRAELRVVLAYRAQWPERDVAVQVLARLAESFPQVSFIHFELGIDGRARSQQLDYFARAWNGERCSKLKTGRHTSPAPTESELASLLNEVGVPPVSVDASPESDVPSDLGPESERDPGDTIPQPAHDSDESAAFLQPNPDPGRVKKTLDFRVTEMEAELARLQQSQKLAAERKANTSRTVFAGFALTAGILALGAAFWHLLTPLEHDKSPQFQQDGLSIALVLITRAVVTASAGAVLFMVLRAADTLTTPFEDRVRLETARKTPEGTLEERLRTVSRFVDEIAKPVATVAAALKGAGKAQKK